MMGGGSGTNGGGSAYHYARQTCPAPTDVTGPAVRVVLGDMGMTQMMGGTAPLGAHMMLHAAPGKLAAGSVTFVASNMGWRTHELVLLPLAAGTPAGSRTPGPEGKVDETGSLGEASADCATGSGEGIRSGSASWVTLTLAPGRYELICNLVNHYADGMHQEFVVTP